MYRAGAAALLIVGLLVPAVPAHATAMTVAAGLVVPGNDGACSLREAISNANADAQTFADCPAGNGADVITLPAGNYDLGDDQRASNSDSAFQITSEITLIGAGNVVRLGATPTILDANGSRRLGVHRHFHVHEGASLHLQDLRLQDGSSDSGGGSLYDDSSGGAIRNEGHTSTLRVAFINNIAELLGGAIYASPGSEVHMTDSSLSQNSAAGGGAIYNDGLTTISGTTLTKNVSNDSGWSYGTYYGFGDGAAVHNQGTLEVGSSTIAGNTVLNGSWGAIYNHDPGDLSLSGSTVNANNAEGIVNYGGSATITDSTISNNTGKHLGGIGNIYISNCGTFGCGTPIYPTMLVRNSTITGNSALSEESNGGLLSDGSKGKLTLINVTLTRNSSTDHQTQTATYPGAQLWASGDIIMRNSIVADPTMGSNCPVHPYIDIAASWIGHNNMTDDSSCDSGGFSNVPDTLLQPLGDNGGPTLTHLTHPASPLIDAGHQGTCASRSGSATDQRGAGFPRTVGSTCDIGAVEADTVELLHVLGLDVDHLRFQAGPAQGNEGLRTSLRAKVDAAMDAVDRNDQDAASGQLGAFVDQVAAHEGGRIAEADADRLMMGAETIVDLFQFGGVPPDDN